MSIYLDNNASTPPLPEVLEAMLKAMKEDFGNPSSAHRLGENARRTIDLSRCRIAELLGCRTDQIFFSSGATESNNWVFKHLLRDRIGPVITTNAEHSSIISYLSESPDIQGRSLIVPIGMDGVVDLETLSQVLEGAAFVSCHWVNNETGVIQPIKEISKLCASSSIPLHVDASQALGKLPIKLVADSPLIDFLTLTAHKLHGPQGVGALYCKAPSSLNPIFFGGGQERNLRPGTENLPGIAGFGKAAEVRNSKIHDAVEFMCRLRDTFEEKVKSEIPNVTVNGNVERRVCNTTNLRFGGVDGLALVAQLDAAGIQCSQSSACTAQIPEPSYVLRAMGLSDDNAFSSIRFSFSELNSFEEIDIVVDVLTKRVKALRDFNQSYCSQD